MHFSQFHVHNTVGTTYVKRRESLLVRKHVHHPVLHFYRGKRRTWLDSTLGKIPVWGVDAPVHEPPASAGIRYLHWQLTFSSTPLPSVKANLCIVHSTCARTLHTYRPVCCRELGFRTSQEYLAGPAGHPCFFYSCCWLTVSMLTELS